MFGEAKHRPWQRRIGRDAMAVLWDFGEVRDGAGEKAVGEKVFWCRARKWDS